MKNILLTTIGLLLFVGCSDPEAEANKLYTQAAQLVKVADETRYLEAYNKRKMAIALIDKIPARYPQSSLSVKILEGDLKIQGHSLDEIRKKITAVNPLSLAAQEGNLDAVKQYLNGGADLNEPDDIGFTPLYWASSGGHKDVVELLISNGVYVNPTSDRGVSPLFGAIRNKHSEIAKLLIAKGADVNAKDKDGETILDSVLNGFYQGEFSKAKREIVQLLQKNGGKFTEKTVIKYVTEGNVVIIGKYLASGLDVNWKDQGERALLHYALIGGNKDLVKLLIAKGADVNAKDEDGRTPLDYAIGRQHPEIAQLLRKHGGKTGEELKAEGK